MATFWSNSLISFRSTVQCKGTVKLVGIEHAVGMKPFWKAIIYLVIPAKR